MAYLKDHGYEARAFYLNVLYVLFILLGSLYAATLNVGVEQGTGATAFSLPRYQVCKMGPISTDEIGELAEAEKVRAAASSDTDEPAATCLAFVGIPTAEDGEFNITSEADLELFNAQQQMFNIAVATAVVNALLFVWSVAMHWRGFGISVHFMAQWVFSAINVGLFAGLAGWMGSVEHLNDENNVRNNVYFEDLNVYAVAVAGLVIAVLDLVGSNLVIYVGCTPARGYKCYGEDA